MPKRHDLPTHKALEPRLGILRDLVKEFSEEYRWTLGMVFEPSKRETVRVKGGDTFTPTEGVALNKAAQRDLIRSALRQLDEAEEALKSAIGLVQDAQPKYAPVPERPLGYPAPWLPGCGPKDRRRQQALQAKRQASGGGYGTT